MHTTATVRDVQYLGAFVRIRADAPGGARLVVDVPAAVGLGSEVGPGRECTLAWRAEHVRAVGDLSSTNSGGQA